MKVEYYFELSCHSIIAVTHLYSYNCHNFIWCAVSLWCVSSTSLALRYLLYIERALWKSIQRHKWHLWKWSRDTLMIFWLRLVVITLYLWMISYWCIPMLWHCLGWFKVRRKWELWTKGRPKLQYHAGCIAHFSFMHRIPNTTNRLQPCACNEPHAYICLYLRSVSMSAFLSDCRSCSAPTSHHPCLESWQMKVHISGEGLGQILKDI